MNHYLVLRLSCDKTTSRFRVAFVEFPLVRPANRGKMSWEIRKRLSHKLNTAKFSLTKKRSIGIYTPALRDCELTGFQNLSGMIRFIKYYLV